MPFDPAKLAATPAPASKFDPAKLAAVKEPEDQITVPQAAGQALKETMLEDVPYLGKATEYVRSGLPGKIAEFGGKIGAPKTGASIGTAIGTVGEMLPKKGYELALLGLPTLSKALGVTGYVEKTVAPKLISFLTNIEQPIVKRGIERAGQLANKELLAPELVENTITKLGEGIKSGRRALGVRLAAIEDAVASKNPGRIIQVKDIADKIESRLSKAGFADAGDVKRELSSKVSDIVQDFKNLHGGTREAVSPIVGPAGQKIVTPAKAAESLPLSFSDALNLRRKIDDVIDQGSKGLLAIPKQTSAFLTEARTTLNDRLKSVDTNFRRANDAFSSMAKNYEQIEKDVFSGKVETIQKRITNLFNKGSVERKLIEKIDSSMEGAHASMDKILDAITAQKFRPAVSPTLATAAGRTGGGILGASGILAAKALAGGPSTAGALAATVAATSPRMNALAIRAAQNPVIAGSIQGLSTGLSAAALAALRKLREQYGQP